MKTADVYFICGWMAIAPQLPLSLAILASIALFAFAVIIDRMGEEA